MAKVTATRGFSGQNGSRTKGERFEYDVEKDPDKLVKLGFVKTDAAKAEAADKK